MSETLRLDRELSTPNSEQERKILIEYVRGLPESVQEGLLKIPAARFTTGSFLDTQGRRCLVGHVRRLRGVITWNMRVQESFDALGSLFGVEAVVRLIHAAIRSAK